MLRSKKIKLAALKDEKEVCFIHNEKFSKNLPLRTCTAKTVEKFVQPGKRLYNYFVYFYYTSDLITTI